METFGTYNQRLDKLRLSLGQIGVQVCWYCLEAPIRAGADDCPTCGTPLRTAQRLDKKQKKLTTRQRETIHSNLDKYQERYPPQPRRNWKNG